MSYDEDRDYYLDCGCWSGWSDHRCRVGNGKNRFHNEDGNPFPYCRGCGVPDDCYCHEMCGEDGYSCDYHKWEKEHEPAE